MLARRSINISPKTGCSVLLKPGPCAVEHRLPFNSLQLAPHDYRPSGVDGISNADQICRRHPGARHRDPAKRPRRRRDGSRVQGCTRPGTTGEALVSRFDPNREKTRTYRPEPPELDSFSLRNTVGLK